MTQITRIVHLLPAPAIEDARQATTLARRLSPEEFDVRVVMLQGGDRGSHEDVSDRVRSRSLRRRWTLDPFAWMEFRSILMHLRPDVVHAWGRTAFRYAATATATAAGARRSPCVLSLSRRQHGPAGWIGWLDERLSRRAARIVVPHEHVRQACVAQGLPAERFAVVAPGVCLTPPPQITRQEWIDRLGLAPGSRLIGAAGPLVRSKRLKDVLWAAELVYVLHKNSCLLLWGDGPERDALMRFARQLGGENRVCFLANDPSDDGRLALLDVFWSGSQCEGIPTDMLQAMAAGVPVVASDIPGHRALVVDGQTGFLAKLGSRTDFAKATDMIYHDPQLARRLGQEGRRAAASYSVDRMVAGFAEVYRRLSSKKD